MQSEREPEYTASPPGDTTLHSHGHDNFKLHNFKVILKKLSPNLAAQWVALCFMLWLPWIQILVRDSVKMTEVIRVFPQSLQPHSGRVP
jgi:hypothetical protein